MLYTFLENCCGKRRGIRAEQEYPCQCTRICIKKAEPGIPITEENAAEAAENEVGMEHLMEEKQLAQFQQKLAEEEKSRRTIEKYGRDLRAFLRYLGETGRVDKAAVIRYKESLLECYAVSSVNSMLAALNRFFKEQGWYDCVVKLVRVQREAFRSQEKELSREEYFRLVKAAEKRGKRRLSYLMQTLCATGIRISELPFITVEAAKRGSAVVRLKGKTRTVLLPAALCESLLGYAIQEGIRKGSIFVTRNGRPMDRSNVLHEMKKLGREAGVERSKIFPHNLRHLFACTYYEMEKDITHLADLLGHSSINTTRIYTMSSGRKQAEQIERLGLLWIDMADEKKPHNVYYAVTGKYISLNLTPIIPAISVYVNLLSERNQRQIVRKRQNQNGKAEICPESKESKRETGKSAHENRTIEAVYLGGLF